MPTRILQMKENYREDATEKTLNATMTLKTPLSFY